MDCLPFLMKMLLLQVRAPMEGLREWLEALDTAGVPCAVASTLDRLTLLAALQRMGLRKYFQVRLTFMKVKS
jgi:beta-phosphoglucomutase-like phosphatase (HAD superfamily)